MEKPANLKDSIGAYAVQCFRCFKWRLIPTKEDFEAIREHFTEDPWHCAKMPNNSCNKPADIEYDTTRIWVIDRPNIPKAPANTERLVMMRKDLSKMDIYYLMPNGKRVRGTNDVAKFLQSHPQYKKRMSISKFCFVSPKIAEETVAEDCEWRLGLGNKKQKMKNSG
ncbi:Methyl-CpG-binding domain-containing protein 1 [Rhynchospora pubera]|uniref:Methyl-CpG-binding domain-containing protein 1 n=1 Tax=Rhynchospora pubera TaxID=906938 RepID=A0AAV8F6S2_9POAL|nr:Methyl-CpG-binding domain-containing protein 1 [Rhynchospora pubera]